MSISIDTISDVHNHGLDVKNREIYLHSYVANSEEDPGVDYKMANIFYKNIRLLDTISHEPIIIHMQSVGGDWNAGMAIYDAMCISQSYITVIVYGQAESMSSVITQAADKRVMMPNSYFMCHFGSTAFCGNHLDVIKAAAFEKKAADLMMDIYADACLKGKYFKEQYKNLSHDKVKNYLKRKFKDGDWYLDSHEAVFYGLADCVLNTRRYTHINSLK